MKTDAKLPKAKLEELHMARSIETEEEVKMYIEERRKAFPKRNKEGESEPGKTLSGLRIKHSGDAITVHQKVMENIRRKLKGLPTVPLGSEGTSNGDAPDTNRYNQRRGYRKNKVCRFWRDNGSCAKGDHCNFSHDLNASSRSSTRLQLPPPSHNLFSKMFNENEEETNLKLIKCMRFLVRSGFLTKSIKDMPEPWDKNKDHTAVIKEDGEITAEEMPAGNSESFDISEHKLEKAN